MQNEQTDKADTQGAETNKPSADSEKPLSLVDEAKKVRDEIKAENDRRETLLKEEQKLASERMLGGTSGGHVEAEVKEETPKEYMDKVMGGNL